MPDGWSSSPSKPSARLVCATAGHVLHRLHGQLPCAVTIAASCGSPPAPSRCSSPRAMSGCRDIWPGLDKLGARRHRSALTWKVKTLGLDAPAAGDLVRPDLATGRGGAGEVARSSEVSGCEGAGAIGVAGREVRNPIAAHPALSCGSASREAPGRGVGDVAVVVE
jgi:hypothetical protein